MSGGLWFLVTGGAAAAVHLGVFVLLTQWLPRLWPELANAAGFAVAFFLSFVGHRFLSFAGTSLPWLHSLLRFSATALSGFALNELVFSLLLRQFGWPSWLALFCALAAAAGQTFLLGRYWAFRR